MGFSSVTQMVVHSSRGSRTHAIRKQTQNAINLWFSSVACCIVCSVFFFLFFLSIFWSKTDGRRDVCQQTSCFRLIPFNANELRISYLISLDDGGGGCYFWRRKRSHFVSSPFSVFNSFTRLIGWSLTCCFVKSRGHKSPVCCNGRGDATLCVWCCWPFWPGIVTSPKHQNSTELFFLCHSKRVHYLNCTKIEMKQKKNYSTIRYSVWTAAFFQRILRVRTEREKCDLHIFHLWMDLLRSITRFSYA